ncbi:uncharacterized protein LOC128673673 [Plodia interpunctella]|uniref:uncharacterized protein LOC128673673 n=1 Tax=Plodia interpunctella TaxID=58824 RepID=UPI0023677521|nr:uncharacterized protein LOC128673673 [Plodia interpunctella]
MYLKLLILLFCALIGKTVGSFRCYACSFNSMDTDQSCLTITNTTHHVECPYTYCTILRQELNDPPGVVASFVRGCEDDPAYLNHEVSDWTYRTYYRACTNSLCNVGDGIQSVVGGNLSPTPQFEGANLLVPGTGGAASLHGLTNNLILLFICNFVLRCSIIE